MLKYLHREFNTFRITNAFLSSFATAIIAPLRKKGDSEDALDYRPILLLTSVYKLFTKIISTRLGLILGFLISQDQNGFVKERQMEDSSNIMLAALLHQYENLLEQMDGSSIIVLPDLSKAYDSLERDFLYAVLANFGFDERFVSLIHGFHSSTIAQFQVNGVLSSAIDLSRGIQQGCPLAPLLFLIAVEVLGMAVKQNPAIQEL